VRSVKVLTDPKAFELLADDTRRRIINLLKAKELTVSQLAEQIDKTPQNIYHHIRKLVDGGLLEVAREERIENFVEKYYRATAEIFEVTHGTGEEDLNERETKQILQSLFSVGLVRKLEDQTLVKVLKILRRQGFIGFSPDLSKKLEKLDAGVVIKLHTVDYAQILMMNDKQFYEYQELQKELRDLLTS